jgi:subtilisin
MDISQIKQTRRTSALKLGRRISIFITGLLANAVVASTNAPAARLPLQIITCRKGVDMEALMHELGLTPKFRYCHFNSFAGPMPQAISQKLKTDPRVLFVEADGQVKLCGQTNGFGVVRMGVDHFPPAHLNGIPKLLDVDVAVLDTGIDPHSDLPPSYHAASMIDPDNTSDELGHGTGVAGVIGAIDNGYGVVGVATGVRIWNIKQWSAAEDSWADSAAAMDYIYQFSSQISVVNMSFVNAGSNSPVNTIHYFIRQLVEAGMVVVAAAGNEARDLAGPDGIYGTGDDSFPASFPETMAVSATAVYPTELSDTVWNNQPGLGSNFSQIERTNGGTYGTNFVSSPGGAIDVAAPGVNIATTLPGGTNGYGFRTGTSLAAPHVTGLVALYIAAHGRATNAAGVFAIRQAIINGSLPQSQWQPHGLPYNAVTNNTGDPDTHPEPLAIASENWIPQPIIAKISGAPGNFQFQFAAVPGYDYTVQSATDLTAPIAWTNVATVSGTNFVALRSVTDTNASSQIFYQVKRNPSP